MNWIVSWLLWLDAEPVRYWSLAWTVYGCTAAMALAAPGSPAVPARTSGRLLFAGGVLLTLAAFRWPTWFVPSNFNPDEAEIIAGAITLRHYPIYWKFVDGSTHGPFCELPLVVASVPGAPLNYITARMVAAVLLATSLFGVWGTLRCFTSERVARLGVLSGLTFWAVVTFSDYVHYSSELSGLCLIALAGWGLAVVLTSDKPGARTSWLIFTSGLMLGAVPFAKLQSGPQAVALALVALVLLWSGSGALHDKRWRLTGWFIAGGVSVPVLILGFLWLYGLWGQFWTSFILNNVAYSHTGQPISQMPSRFLGFSLTGYSFAWFLIGTLAFTLLYARPNPRTTRTLRTAITVSWIMLGVAFGTVLLPGRDTTHYLHLLVIPVTLLAGLVLASAMNGQAGKNTRRFAAWVPAVWFGVLALGPQIFNRAVSYHEFLGGLSTNLAHRKSKAASYIVERARETDTLAIWGWEPNLYVQTGLAQGTRDGSCAYQIGGNPLQSFYIGRYLSDMRRRRPVWFVDAVGPGAFMYVDRSVCAHEQTPALRDFVAQHYELQTEIENKRIYRLKEPAAP